MKTLARLREDLKENKKDFLLIIIFNLKNKAKVITLI